MIQNGAKDLLQMECQWEWKTLGVCPSLQPRTLQALLPPPPSPPLHHPLHYPPQRRGRGVTAATEQTKLMHDQRVATPRASHGNGEHGVATRRRAISNTSMDRQGPVALHALILKRNRNTTGLEKETTSRADILSRRKMGKQSENGAKMVGMRDMKKG